MRALIAGIVHESSTFTEVTGTTTLGGFDLHEGAGLTAAFAGTNTCVGGYLAACEQHGVTAVPALHARAEPGGAVEPSACQALLARLAAAAAAAGPADVVLLDLHGAGALTGGESLDLAVLAGLRAVVGDRVPIAVTFDLHANLPAELPPLASALVGFQEYPHTDMASRAARAAGIVFAQAAGTARPVTRLRRLPMILPPSATLAGPGARARELAQAEEASAGVLACTVSHGYPYADTAQAAASVVTVTDGDPGLADAVNERLAGWLWSHREEFAAQRLPPEQALQQARGARHPVVIGDATDNPGSGAPGDSTYLLRALLDSGLTGCLATIHDPAAVAAAVAAGVGATAEFAIGGRHGWASGPPLHARATVRAITDGRVVQQSMRRGKVLEFGTSARLAVGGVDVIVSANRSQVFDPEIVLLHGIVPQRCQVIAVKSMHHFKAGFAGVAGHVLVTDSPGPLTRHIQDVPRAGPSRLLWPMSTNDPTGVKSWAASP
jgi:microcystin degradation protein MlrC